MNEVYCFGSGEIDQLGLGEDVLECKRPRKVFPNSTYPNIKVVKIACGAMHTLLISSMGEVYSWGCNDDFALGRTQSESNVPGKVEIQFPMSDISAGDSHSTAYNCELNQVFLWGTYRNTEGKFGESIKQPQLLDKRRYKGKVSKVVCGSNHTIMLASQKVYLWGNSEFCQTGR